jgi:DNA-binding transcriptional LysR family regulator
MVPQDFALTYLIPVFAELSSRYPEISLELELRPQLVPTLVEGFDVTICMESLPDSGLIARKITILRHGIYASPTYLKQAGAVKTPADLALHECLRMVGPIDRTTHWTVVRGDRAETVPVKGRFVANSVRFLRELAFMGRGIAVVDEVIARPAVQAGTLVRILPDWSPPPVPVHALTFSKLLPARAKVFLETMSGHLSIEGRPALLL